MILSRRHRLSAARATILAAVTFCGVAAARGAGAPPASPGAGGPSPEAVRLFDYDAKAPLDVQETALLEVDGARVRDISYASPRGGRVTAYLVEPPAGGPFAGIVFQHPGQGSRASFLPEAIADARAGAVSILIDAPFMRPAPWRRAGGGLEDATPDREMYAQAVVDLRRAVDLLLARPDVDPKRIAFVGHSFGATWGGVLAGIETRIRAYVLMAGLPRLSANVRESTHPALVEVVRATPGDVVDRYVAAIEPMDAANFVGRSSPASLLFQFARFDVFISEAAAKEYERLAGAPKRAVWYDAGHELSDPAALADRTDFLAAEIGISPDARSKKKRDRKEKKLLSGFDDDAAVGP